MASGYEIRVAPNADDRDPQPVPGKVGKVCRDWMVHEDGVVAYRLQEEEKSKHYGLNRSQRRTVREDIVNAKIVQHEEELVQQERRMQEIQDQRRIQEMINERIAQHEKELQEQEDFLRQIENRKTLAQEDERLAKEVMENIMYEEAEQQMQQETEDERIARMLQEKEQRRYQRYKVKKEERELARERRRLERSIAQAQSLPGTNLSPADDEGDDTGNRRVRDSDGRLEDVGDFSDFLVPPPGELDESQAKEIQEQQDEELARLLQEQEHKRSGNPQKDKLKQLEEKDAELARIMQEQEKLKLKKLKNRMKQMSLHEKNLMVQDHHSRPPERPPSMPESDQSHPVHQSYSSSSDEHLNNQPPNPYYPRSSYLNNSSSHQLGGAPVTPDEEEEEDSPLALHIRERDQEIRQRNMESHQFVYSSNHQPPRYNHHSPQTPPSISGEEPLPPFSRSDPNKPNVSPEEGPPASGQANTPTFNIAAAIDPTYHRRSKNLQGVNLSPEFKTGLNRGNTFPPPPDAFDEPVPVSSQLVEYNYYDDDYGDDDGPPMVPVQGQRRISKGRKSGKNPTTSGQAGDKRSSCKQQ